MWEVTATNGPKERRAITSRWNRANQLAKKALDMGWQVRIKSYYADVLSAEPDGNFVMMARKIKPQDAARFCVLWIKKGDHSGCVVWPHGRPMPERWDVAS